MFFLDFILTVVVIALAPGIGVAMTIRSGLSGRLENIFYCTLGCVLCVVPYFIANIFGVAQFLSSHEIFLRLIKIVSAIYLFLFSIHIIRKWKIETFSTYNNESMKHLIKTSFLGNFFNPKIIIFSFSIIPDFISSSADYYILHVLILTVIFSIAIFMSWYCYGFLAMKFKNFLLVHKKIAIYIKNIFALFQIILALKIILTL